MQPCEVETAPAPLAARARLWAGEQVRVPRALPLCVLISTAMLSHCSSLFWKKTSEVAGAQWLSENELVEAFFHYEEKRPFPPIAVTHTLKRAYRTELRLQKVDADGRVQTAARMENIPGRIFVGPVPFRDSLIGARSPRGADGVPEDLVVLTGNLSRSRFTSIVLAPGHSIVRLVAAPSRQLFVVLTRSETQNRLFLIRSWEDVASAPSRAATLEGGEPDLAWDKDSSGVFVHQAGRVFLLSAGTRPGSGPPSLVAVSRFPRCFVPETIGGSISPEGRRYFRADAQREPTISRVSDFISLSQVEMVTDARRIGRGCPG